MIEYFTDAFVLDKQDYKETDGLLILYTQELGKVSVKARGLKKILSKSSAHLEPLYFAKIRLIQNKNGGYQLVDAISYSKDKFLEIKNNPNDLIKFLRLAKFINDMSFELHPDEMLWQGIKKIFVGGVSEEIAYKFILKILGFDPENAYCQICDNTNNLCFVKKDHNFLCRFCIGENKLEKISNLEIILL